MNLLAAEVELRPLAGRRDSRTYARLTRGPLQSR